MLRLRFSSGLILGLLLGIPVGALVALWVLPSAGPETATASQVQELSRKLEVAKEDRQRVDHQLEEFQKMAEQMAASFNSLEQRFKTLQEEYRVQETRAKQPAAAPAAVAPSDHPAPEPPAAPVRDAPPRESAPEPPADGHPPPEQ